MLDSFSQFPMDFTQRTRSRACDAVTLWKHLRKCRNKTAWVAQNCAPEAEQHICVLGISWGYATHGTGQLLGMTAWDPLVFSSEHQGDALADL